MTRPRREHVLDGVRIHTITPEDAGVTVNGVRVVTLKDLVAIKLLSGLNNPARSKDLGDVEELIRSIPLDKRFAAKLPREVRQNLSASSTRFAPPIGRGQATDGSDV